MPLHLLGKKSWNVYNADNIARVRRDEANARAEQAERERRQRDGEAEARLALLRGQDSLGTPSTDHAQNTGHPDELQGRQRKQRRLDGEDDTDRDIRLARSRRHDKNAHQGIKPADAEGPRLSHSTAAPAWYMTVPTDQSDQPSGPGRDVWGNEDAGRRARDQKRLDANDPLAAMKKGIAQLRHADENRRAWREQRERDLAGVEPLDELDLDAPSTATQQHGPNRSTEEQERHSSRRHHDRHHRHHHRHRHSHHHRHRHRRDRSRSASPRPRQERPRSRSR